MRVIVEMLSYPFLVRAFVGGIFVSLCASLLGVSLVLKRYSMIGDGLSHVSFGALSVAIAAGWSPLAVSIPVVVLAAFFLLRITENGKLKSDAAIAMISASALAIGILVTSMTTGMTTDISSYMFGSILAMRPEDLVLSLILSAVVLGLFVFCYHKVFAVTFDENFARATGIDCYTDRRYHCAGNADDGGNANLQPGYLPGADIDAGVEKLPGCGDFLRVSFHGLLYHRNDRILHPLYTGGGQRGCGKPAVLPFV